MPLPKSATKSILCIVPFALCALAGCAAPDPDDEAVITESSSILGGTGSFSRPEIGYLNVGGRGCTGTVVDSQYLITAAHCIDAYTRPVRGSFQITKTNGVPLPQDEIVDFTYTLGNTRSGDIGFDLGTPDVALARLATPLPAGVTPAVIAASPPPQAAFMTDWGYGCGGASGPSGIKRFLEGQLFEGACYDSMCDGDSGGPLVIGRAGEGGAIFGINSGEKWDTRCLNNIDVFGDASGRGGPGLAAVRAFGHSVESNRPVNDFPTYARTSGAKLLAGDFNNDGIGDVALSGGVNWQTIPVAFGTSFGSFTVTNRTVASFPGLAFASGAKVVSGDFNGDGKTDIAVTGHAGWGTIPLALSNGDGTFTFANPPVTNQPAWAPTWAASSNVQAVAGDFDKDGRTDIALVGHAGWGTIPVAFSRVAGTSGSFAATNFAPSDTNFNVWAASSNVKALAGDFDGDLDTDIALVGHAGWGTIPVASSSRDGRFTISNQAVPLAPHWASMFNVKAVAGDFDADGDADIAFTGNDEWLTIAFALSQRNGNFTPANMPFATAPAWSRQQGAQVVAVNADGIRGSDLVMSGGPSWGSMPTVFFHDRPLYTFCARESETCAFTGTREVRYGAAAANFYRRVTDGTACDNDTFGDPAGGVGKLCSIGLSGFTYCADEGGTCNVTGGMRIVAYGANGNFSYRRRSGLIPCNNDEFGDPIGGAWKACYVAN